jgi:hypothetical protein
MKTQVNYTFASEVGTTTGNIANYDDGVKPLLPDAGDEISLGAGEPTGPFIVISVTGPFDQHGLVVYTVKLRRK